MIVLASLTRHLQSARQKRFHFIEYPEYRLALVVNGNCVLRYDNEAGKGDHKHIGENEIPYIFTTPKALLEDFWNDLDNWRF